MAVVINLTIADDINTSIPTPSPWFEGYSIVYYISVAVLLQLSVLINSLIILVVCCTPRLRTTPNVFISSLAVCELLFAVFITARSVIASKGLLTGNWPGFGHIIVRVMIFIWLATLCSNYTNILLISLERWLYITQPFLHVKMNRTLLVVSSLIFAWAVPLVTNVELITEEDINYQLQLRLAHLFPAFHAVWSGALCAIYVHICVITRRQIRVICKLTIPAERPGRRSPGGSGFKHVRANWKTFKLLVVVFGTFFVLNTPGILFNIYLHSKGCENYWSDVPWYIKFLTVIHNCSNYFIYVHQDRTFYTVCCGHFRRVRSLLPNYQVEMSSGLNKGPSMSRISRPSSIPSMSVTTENRNIV
ncbi:bombesin receptor subtype-3-like [Biomphalaria glabrata]|uniref:Bombesin receptor subtype-3-like n=1 Tax=Biomphalaria glabrata TaxID=6526 RepID=A0A9W3A880_BIOGL|nr:bombesin receptor subtype-3-like [Biomphalaria glabrata]